MKSNSINILLYLIEGATCKIFHSASSNLLALTSSTECWLSSDGSTLLRLSPCFHSERGISFRVRHPSVGLRWTLWLQAKVNLYQTIYLSDAIVVYLSWCDHSKLNELSRGRNLQDKAISNFVWQYFRFFKLSVVIMLSKQVKKSVFVLLLL